MVKKYEPCQKYYDYEEHPSLEMRESSHGNFVKLETFKNEMARMSAQLRRQDTQIAKLKEKISQIKNIIT